MFVPVFRAATVADRAFRCEGDSFLSPARDARPQRPAQLWPNQKVWWARGAWRTQGRGYDWEYEPRWDEWHRGEKIPLLGDTRSATWALQEQRLLREQNRLLEDQNCDHRRTGAAPPVARSGLALCLGLTTGALVSALLRLPLDASRGDHGSRTVAPLRPETAPSSAVAASVSGSFAATSTEINACSTAVARTASSAPSART